MTEPFDRTLESPISAILALRSDGHDSVVAIGGPSQSQARAYRRGMLDATLTKLAKRQPSPHVIVATGSAGGGKSAAVEEQARANPELYSDIIQDATHSDSPRDNQAATLLHRLAPLADGAKRPERPILLAANTGMLLQLFDAWDRQGAFTELKAAILPPLGLAPTPSELPPAQPVRAHVVNLDDRPTAGQSGLLSEILPLLDPDIDDGVFDGADRCGTCTVRDWCPVRTNAVLAAGVAKDTIVYLASAAAMEKGRHDSPRAMWDWLSRVVAPPESFAGEPDPCDRAARAAADGDEEWRAKNLLPSTLFAASGDLGARIKRLDPSLGASRTAYETLSAAGIEPERDAKPLDALAMLEPRAQALAATAAALHGAGAAAIDDATGGAGSWRATIGRAALGAVLLANASGEPLALDPDAALFGEALAAYQEWQTAKNHTADTARIRAIWEMADAKLGPLVQNFGGGLARLFGREAEGYPFLPLRSFDVRRASAVHVAVKIDITTVEPVPDLQTELNPEMSDLIGHEPLAIRLNIPGGEFLLDLPGYRLLMAARNRGLVAASESDERLHALRRAAEALARLAAIEKDARLLADDTDSNASYLITEAPSFGRSNRPIQVRLVTA